jgi:hypothetical protein
MPRLDNSDGIVIEVYGLQFDDDDPGKTPPVDLCSRCAGSWLNAELFIDHPSYDDDEYRCFECDVILTSDDDDWFE